MITPPRGQLEDEMMSKKLTQAVFEDLPADYRWAAVDAYGDAYSYTSRPRSLNREWIVVTGEIMAICGGYDTTNWQNSLIERNTGITVSQENQALAEAQAEIERLKSELKAKDEALQAIIDNQVVEIAAGKAWVNILEATIDSLDAEIEALKESQSDLRGFLHEQIEKNFELLNRQKWISVESVILPPLHKEVLVFTRDKEFLVHARTQNMVAYANWATHWQHRPAPPEGV